MKNKDIGQLYIFQRERQSIPGDRGCKKVYLCHVNVMISAVFPFATLCSTAVFVVDAQEATQVYLYSMFHTEAIHSSLHQA